MVERGRITPEFPFDKMGRTQIERLLLALALTSREDLRYKTHLIEELGYDGGTSAYARFEQLVDEGFIVQTNKEEADFNPRAQIRPLYDFSPEAAAEMVGFLKGRIAQMGNAIVELEARFPEITEAETD